MEKGLPLTGSQRQKKRNKALKQKALDLGFSSWSAVETQIIKNKVKLTIDSKS